MKCLKMAFVKSIEPDYAVKDVGKGEIDQESLSWIWTQAFCEFVVDRYWEPSIERPRFTL